MELFKLLGASLHFSTSFHPQTDGQTERVNNPLGMYCTYGTLSVPIKSTGLGQDARCGPVLLQPSTE